MSINPCDQVGFNFFMKPIFSVILSDVKIILHQSTNEGAILDPRIIRFGNTALGLDGSMKTEMITRHNQYFERIKGKLHLINEKRLD